MGLENADLIKGSPHEPQKTNAKLSEYIKQLDDEMTTRAHYVERHQTLAQVELMRQNLLDVLLTLDRETLQ
jgi:hypothetical protein